MVVEAGSLEAWARTVWAEHSSSLLAVLAIAAAFRIGTAFVERWAATRYKTRDEAAVAVYRLVGLVHHTIQARRLG